MLTSHVQGPGVHSYYQEEKKNNIKLKYINKCSTHAEGQEVNLFL